MAKYIKVNKELCMSCHTCEIACAVEHSSDKDLYKAVKAGEKPGYRIKITGDNNKIKTVTCIQCVDPKCVPACKKGAIKQDKKDGRVTIDPDICDGLKKCIEACPFGAITMSADGKTALKCDLCIERLEAGEDPACVSSCPTHAIELIERKSSKKEKP